MQVAIVTGASSGIGFGCATKLAEMGMAVVGTGRDPDRLGALALRPSGLLLVTGPAGAGKSTTMKMLTGYLTPSAGSASIGGHDSQSDRLSAAQLLGYLPENGPLYPDMTPHTMLTFFADARGMSTARRRDRRTGSLTDWLSGGPTHRGTGSPREGAGPHPRFLLASLGAERA